MVRVNIPLDTPLDEGSDEDEVGVMSDIVESDLDDEIDDPDWEEVKSRDGDKNEDNVVSSSKRMSKLPELPANGVTISIGKPRRSKRGRKSKKNGANDDGEDDNFETDSGDEDLGVKKKKKRTVDLNEMVRKTINRAKITKQTMKHKVSLLLYLARGFRLVRMVRCNVISGLSLSIVDSRFQMKRVGRKKQSDRDLLKKFTDTFLEVIQLSTDEDKQAKHMQQPFMLNLLDCYATLEATSLLEFVVMFCACLKALKPNLPMRIVNVLRPITFRANIIPKPAEGEAFEAPANWEDDECVGSTGVVEKLDYWVEVWLEDEKKWCCVDLCNEGRLDEPLVLTELNRPFYYLVAYDLDRNCVKSVEKNYCEDWFLPAFKKGRCDDKWWQTVMSRLGPVKENDKDQADEVKNDEILNKQDLPTSDNGFRNHPLYVLEKHLLKFQAIYPPEVAPLAFFKNQPVYPRDCVQTCMSRETWLRQAKTVKIGESPYKIVTARPKRDKYTGELIRDLPLELFGSWQTEPYDPPAAKDGKVPRNCYGNVDMYQPEMLPKGCAWLKLPGLPRVANKLGIDCAAAVVGFDNHCGGGYGAHPVMDGFIVCEEHADTLRIAWEEQQENGRRREEEKRTKRIWDNWKRLLKAAMIREKLRVKYKNS